MKLMLGLVALVVAGCAAASPQPAMQYRWVKAGIGQEETARDAVQCQQYGSQIALQNMRMDRRGPYYDDRVAALENPLAAHTQAATHECLAELGYQLIPVETVVAR